MLFNHLRRLSLRQSFNNYTFVFYIPLPTFTVLVLMLGNADSSQDGIPSSVGGDDGDSLNDENYIPPEFTADTPPKPEKQKSKKKR